MNSKLGVEAMSTVQYLILLADAAVIVSGSTTTIQLVSPALPIVRCEAQWMPATPVHQVDNLTWAARQECITDEMDASCRIVNFDDDFIILCAGWAANSTWFFAYIFSLPNLRHPSISALTRKIDAFCGTLLVAMWE